MQAAAADPRCARALPWQLLLSLVGQTVPLSDRGCALARAEHHRAAAQAEEAQGSSLGTSAAAVAACARGTSVGSVAATAASACGALAAAVATCARGASRRSGAVRHGEPRRHSRHGHPCHGHADDDRHPRRGGGRARLHVMTVSTMSRAQELTPLYSTLRRVSLYLWCILRLLSLRDRQPPHPNLTCHDLCNLRGTG